MPIIFFALIISAKLFAQEGEKEEAPVSETNIVCFAANNKWICAPEDQQDIANAKAIKSLESKTTEMGSADVVIKPITIPQFNSNPTVDSNSNLSNPKDTSTIGLNNKSFSKQPKVRVNDTSAENPYANLWSNQLIGVSSYQNAIRFVKQKNLKKDDILILKSIRNGEDWWIVLFGLYKDKQTGLAHQKDLPANIQNHWLRPLKGLVINAFIKKY